MYLIFFVFLDEIFFIIIGCFIFVVCIFFVNFVIIISFLLFCYIVNFRNLVIILVEEINYERSKRDGLIERLNKKRYFLNL